jgi:hypothetical protein
LNLAKSGHYNLAATARFVDNLDYVKLQLRASEPHTPGSVVIPIGFIGYLVAALGIFVLCYSLTVVPAPYFKKRGHLPRPISLEGRPGFAEFSPKAL